MFIVQIKNSVRVCPSLSAGKVAYFSHTLIAAVIIFSNLEVGRDTNNFPQTFSVAH